MRLQVNCEDRLGLTRELLMRLEVHAIDLRGIELDEAGGFIYLPLITTNCIVLGLALLNVSAQHDFLQSLVYGLGGGLGFCLVLMLFATLRERLAAADVPLPFRGIAIAMITAGLMSLAFMGFTGLIKP